MYHSVQYDFVLAYFEVLFVMFLIVVIVMIVLEMCGSFAAIVDDDVVVAIIVMLDDDAVVAAAAANGMDVCQSMLVMDDQCVVSVDVIAYELDEYHTCPCHANHHLNVLYH